MVKGNHVYTLNYNLKSLEQKQNQDHDIVVKTSPNYVINEDKTAHEFQMIESLDDIIIILRTIDTDEKQIINLIYKDDDLNELFCKLKQAGYEPKINWNGKVTHLALSLNKTLFLIQTQQLVPDSLDGSCSVSSAKVYNNMNKAMVDFSKKVFKSEHKSFYTHQDVKIRDGYRTVVPVGRLLDTAGTNFKLADIDVSKAFSYALALIQDVPVFNELESFKPFQSDSKY